MAICSNRQARTAVCICGQMDYIRLQMAQKQLCHLSGLILRGITEAIRTTPATTLEKLLGASPLDLSVMEVAAGATDRLSLYTD